MFFWGSMARAEQIAASTLVSPRPVIEKVTGEKLTLANKDHAFKVFLFKEAGAPISEGIKLLKRRQAALGYHVQGVDESSFIILTRCDRATFSRLLKKHGIGEDIEPNRMRQAYSLTVETAANKAVRVTVQAVDDWGLFYGMVSLSQLMEANEAGDISVPAVQIVDYPEIAHRLAKCSASDSPVFVNRYAAWLPLFKISQIGLQYHGKNSKDPSPEFTTNIKTLCPRLRREGTLESIVYFCPFRGEGPRGADHLKGAYDFSQEADRKAYADYLLWIMGQQANGIEVDYNDWPGSKEVPIANVLNLACETIKKKYPDAYVLYCPPSRGVEAYNTMATPQMHETLSRVPEKVWPLWVGLPTRTMAEPARAKPLTAANSEQWATIAGRRPFLWINRIAVNVPWSVSRPVPGSDGHAFAGDLFPRDLNHLFEGVHLNTGRFSQALLEGKPREPGDEAERQFDKGELVYLATVADFLWNPAKWEPKESYRRAVRFVEVMSALEPDRAAKSTLK